MINKHGQALTIFVILIPVILIMLGMIIELSIISYNKVHLNSLTKSIIASCIENPRKDDIINLYSKNGIDDDMQIDLSSGIDISFTHKVDSFLGKIIAKDSYDLKISVKGKMANGKIVYTKGEK